MVLESLGDVDVKVREAAIKSLSILSEVQIEETIYRLRAEEKPDVCIISISFIDLFSDYIIDLQLCRLIAAKLTKEVHVKSYTEEQRAMLLSFLYNNKDSERTVLYFRFMVINKYQECSPEWLVSDWFPNGKVSKMEIPLSIHYLIQVMRKLSEYTFPLYSEWIFNWLWYLIVFLLFRTTLRSVRMRGNSSKSSKRKIQSWYARATGIVTLQSIFVNLIF